MQPEFRERTQDTFLNRHLDVLSRTNPEIILLGDSMLERLVTIYNKDIWQTKGFQKLKVFNAGIGGDKIENVLFRIQNMLLLEYFKPAPKKFILMIGTNNIERYGVEYMGKGVQQIVDLIRAKFAETEIVVLGILPRKSQIKGMDETKMLDKVGKFNALLGQIFTGQKGVTIVDFSGLFIDNDGKMNTKLFSDLLHLNLDGNKIFVDELLKLITTN